MQTQNNLHIQNNYIISDTEDLTRLNNELNDSSLYTDYVSIFYKY